MDICVMSKKRVKFDISFGAIFLGQKLLKIQKAKVLNIYEVITIYWL